MFDDSPKDINSVIREGYRVTPIEYLNQGWEIFKQNTGGFISFFLLCAVISLILGGPANFTSDPEEVSNFARTWSSVGSLINGVISGPLNAGIIFVAFKILKRQATTFSDFFKGFQNGKFLQFFLASLVVGLLVVLGLILLILPGIYLAIAYSFTVPFMVDRKLGFWEAMETSRKVISKRWFSFFGFLLLLALVNFVGALLCGLGLLVTIPLTSCAIVAAYRDIVGLNASSEMAI
ncbi:hypothetical protein [Leptolyngbya ohadii]|uniref:hypothetical protein n=1 Tax=Leptolyngbya ohadii TaxID=1962290 RepID=UPI0015C6236F|nr:hypothetical protein [Leptolyngbya ohadii]